MGRIVLPACLHTTEWQADKPGLVNHKDKKRCEYYMRHSRKTFSTSLSTGKIVGQSEFKFQKNMKQ
jgi:hypothetical protein